MTIRKISAASAAAALVIAGGIATPAAAQDPGNYGAIVQKDDACFSAIFRAGMPPLFLDGDQFHKTDNNASTTTVGNVIFSCRGTATPEQTPSSTWSGSQNCGAALFGPDGIIFIEGMGHAVINKSGNFKYTCVIGGNAEETIFNFIEAP